MGYNSSRKLVLDKSTVLKRTKGTKMDVTRIPLDFILKAAKLVKRIAYIIAVIGAVTSFGTQVGLLESWKISFLFACGIAGTVDLLAVCAMIALQIPYFPWKGRVGLVFVFTLSVSISANVVAGYRESIGAAIAHAWPVLAYMLAELIANLVRKFAAIVEAKQAEASRPAEVPAPVYATATVTSKTPTKAVTGKPGTAKQKILELASATPRPGPEEIAEKVGVKPAWVKHVIKTHAPTS